MNGLRGDPHDQQHYRRIGFPEALVGDVDPGWPDLPLNDFQPFTVPSRITRAILKSERAPRSLCARPDGKALRSVSSSAAGPQKPGRR
jgi:hypothetical protein